MPEQEFDEAEWRERMEAYRADKDEFFASEDESPIPAEERQSFDGLEYFPLTESFRVVARLQWVQTPEKAKLPATAGPDIEYVRVATLGFSLGGDHHVLTAYRAPGADELLVPFADETNGTETASEGRYLTLSVDDVETGENVVLDFNLAYHPFCVYNDTYVSALPPEENELPLPIQAGERR